MALLARLIGQKEEVENFQHKEHIIVNLGLDPYNQLSPIHVLWHDIMHDETPLSEMLSGFCVWYYQVIPYAY